MKQQTIYDAFLSHSHDDAEQVEYLAAKLEDEAGLKIWLDEWELIPGEPFIQAMSKGLNEAKTCVVVVGSSTPEGWFQQEIGKALNIKASNPSFRVIPLLLPSAKDIFVNDFLELQTWVKFTKNLDAKRPFHKLVSGIQGKKPGRKHSEAVLSKIAPNLQPTDDFPKELTLNFPKLRLDQIIGRTADIEDLRRRLFDNKQVVLVNGMGGIGKTTVAEVYVTQNRDYYKHIAWVSQLTDDFSNDLINSRGLLTSLKIDKQDKSLDQLFDELLLGLKNIPEGPCLMVIDNATNDLSRFYKLLPNQPKWHILVTSRERIANFDLKELGFLSEKEAIALFKKHYKRGKIDDDAIAKIVKNLEYHTLTIEILAKTAQHQNKSPEAINKAVEVDMEADVTISHSSKKIDKVTSYLCSIFKLSDLEEDEKWLLAQFACLPPEFHLEDVLKEIIQPNETREPIFAKLLSNLVVKGWLLEDPDNESYRLHRILNDVLGVSLPIEFGAVGSLVSYISDRLSLDQTKDNPVDKFQWIPYGKAILIQFKTNVFEAISMLQNNLAVTLQSLGNYNEAKELLEKVITSSEENFGKDHPENITYYSNLALVLQDLGNYIGAKELLEKVTASDEKNFGKEHPNTATSYSNLALVLSTLGDYNQAKELLEKATASDEKNFGKEHPTTAKSYSMLGLLLQDLGDYVGAKELLEKATASDEKNFGKEHPTTAKRYSNLATVLRDLGDYNGAKELLEKATASSERNFGKEHPTTAIRYSNLAMVLLNLGDYIQAKELLEKATASDEKTFGKEHPNMAIRYSNLAIVLQSLKDFDGAKKLLVKAIKLDEKNLGVEHPSTAITYSNLASVLQGLGDFKKAKILLEKALAIFENSFGSDHPNTMTVREHLKYTNGKINNS
ncbi:MAG: tetratricopeptide repeat protein [Bacteroidota bacterium]